MRVGYVARDIFSADKQRHGPESSAETEGWERGDGGRGKRREDAGGSKLERLFAPVRVESSQVQSVVAAAAGRAHHDKTAEQQQQEVGGLEGAFFPRGELIQRLRYQSAPRTSNESTNQRINGGTTTRALFVIPSNTITTCALPAPLLAPFWGKNPIVGPLTWRTTHHRYYHHTGLTGTTWVGREK
ncbi:hypothetical protein B7463_g2705, partial [Scytalidium lignicola]